MSSVSGIEEKLRGSFRYLAEGAPEGTLHGALLTSPLPHARIAHLDVTAARALPGVHAVVTATDLPDGYRIGPRMRDRPPLASGKVRFRGEPIVAVAADRPEIATAALALVDLTLDPLPVVSDPEDAFSDASPAVHETGNLCHAFRYEKGDIAEAFAQCAHTIEHFLQTPRQLPCALELEGGVCIPSATGVEIRAATHTPFAIRSLIAEMLRLPEDAVRAVGSPIGGSYGGKEDVHVQPVLALLAWTAKAPVRLALTRQQSMAAATTRHPFRIRIRIGCDGDGRLRAFEADVVVDGGAYASFGPEVLDTGMECIQGVYAFDTARLTGRLAYTNNGVAGAFRGFGALQTLTALELAVDRLAAEVGLDPLDFRQRNLAGADDPGPLGQPLVPQPELPRVARALRSLPAIPAAPASERYVTGTGYALVRKGEGFGGGGPNGAAGELAFTASGRIELRCSLSEMGQGVEAAIRTMLGKTFDIAPDDISAAIGDTLFGRDSGPTSASRGTQIARRLIRAGAPTLTERLLAEAASALCVASEHLRLGPGGVYHRHERRNRPEIGFAALASRTGEIAVPVEVPGIAAHHMGYDCHTLFTCCGARAQVRVDRWTGQVTCTALDLVPACGEPVNARAFEGQMVGAGAQALGFCLTEDQVARDGVFQARNLDGYFLPTIADVPEIGVHPMTWLSPDDPVGLRGGGEIGINAAAPAIANAIADVLGAAPRQLPVSPGWVLETIDGMNRP